MDKQILLRMKELRAKLVILSTKHTSERQFIIIEKLRPAQSMRVLNNQRAENRILAQEYADVLSKSL